MTSIDSIGISAFVALAVLVGLATLAGRRS